MSTMTEYLDQSTINPHTISINANTQSLCIPIFISIPQISHFTLFISTRLCIAAIPVPGGAASFQIWVVAGKSLLFLIRHFLLHWKWKWSTRITILRMSFECIISLFEWNLYKVRFLWFIAGHIQTVSCQWQGTKGRQQHEKAKKRTWIWIRNMAASLVAEWIKGMIIVIAA